MGETPIWPMAALTKGSTGPMSMPLPKISNRGNDFEYVGFLNFHWFHEVIVENAFCH